MFRRYNRWHSRFDQPDPYDGAYDFSNPQSFNRYAYVQNDPVNFADPTGLVSTGEDGGSDPTKTWMGLSGGLFGSGGGGFHTFTTTGYIYLGTHLETGLPAFLAVPVQVTIFLPGGLFGGGGVYQSRGSGSGQKTRPLTPEEREAYRKFYEWSSCAKPIKNKYIKMREEYLKLGGEAFWLEVGAVLGVMTGVFEGDPFSVTAGILLPIGVHYSQRATLNQMNSDYLEEVTKKCGPEVTRPKIN